jgi:phage/plasmid-like protein (TIGR03299 family)
MSAEFESGFFVGESAWHGLGTTLPADTNLSVYDGLVRSGMNWDVYLKPAQFTADNGETTTPLSNKGQPMNYFTMRRMLQPQDDGTTKEVEEVLGCVGKRYEPLQNSQAFEWFNPFIEQGFARLHTAGSLCEGRKVWVLAELLGENYDIGGGDKVMPFLLLSSSHDGSNAVRVGFTPIRVVCANTLAMAHNADASKLIRLKHTKNIIRNLDNVAETVDAFRAEFNATAEQYQRLLAADINSNDIQRYINLVIAGTDDENEIATRSKNIIAEHVMPLLENETNKINGMNGTLWAAYNAVTEYYTHAAGGDGSGKNAKADPLTKRSNRLQSLWFGQNHKKNAEALALALQMAS